MTPEILCWIQSASEQQNWGPSLPLCQCCLRMNVGVWEVNHYHCFLWFDFQKPLWYFFPSFFPRFPRYVDFKAVDRVISPSFVRIFEKRIFKVWLDRKLNLLVFFFRYVWYLFVLHSSFVLHFNKESVEKLCLTIVRSSSNWGMYIHFAFHFELTIFFVCALIHRLWSFLLFVLQLYWMINYWI